MSIDWIPNELRIATLQVLLAARKENPRSGTLEVNRLSEILHFRDFAGYEKILLLLIEEGFVKRQNKELEITIEGVSHLEAQLRLMQSPEPPAKPEGTNFPGRRGIDPDDASGVLAKL